MRCLLWGVACIAALLVLNRIVYWTLLPILFFHGGFTESAYDQNARDDSLTAVSIDTPQGTLYGWERTGTDGAAAIFFGGDASDSSAWLAGLSEQDRQRAFGDATLITVDYPSFGKSEGSISEQAFFEAAEAVYDYAAATHPGAKKVLIGYSLGCAAAAKAAAEHSAEGLILIAPMYDGTTMYFPRTSLLHDYFAPTASVKLDNDALAPLIAERTLVIVSDGDGMTRYADVAALCELFPAKPAMLVPEGIGHGDYWKTDAVLDAIGQFMRETNSGE